ncbi:hypothetical protein [Nitrosomonas ureae]|uniref:hypothetical protein n=1 Tax=Nitrosomonas ureae TaxID=44577 RepID=UPI00072142E7|nr:hypothetical protein [Nitrosomonas ureae]ALQ51690.1 hypothetical protein ATY38_10940 [Nitrosomonas ureae]
MTSPKPLVVYPGIDIARIGCLSNLIQHIQRLTGYATGRIGDLLQTVAYIKLINGGMQQRIGDLFQVTLRIIFPLLGFRHIIKRIKPLLVGTIAHIVQHILHAVTEIISNTGQSVCGIVGVI